MKWLRQLLCIHVWIFRNELECIIGKHNIEIHNCLKCEKIKIKDYEHET